MQMKKCFWAAAIAALFLAQQAQAAPKFFYQASQVVYKAVPGEVLQVPVYIVATTDGAAAIQAADGLFSSGVRLSLASPAAGGTIQSVTADLSWDGSQLPTVTSTLAQLYVDRASGTGPGALPDNDLKIKIGTFHILVGNSPDNLIHFDLQDYEPGSSEVVGYDGTEFDPDISPSQFIIQVPEPASASLLLIGSSLLMMRRRTN